MQNEGKKFEIDIKGSVPEEVYYLRIIDPALSFGQGEASKTRFTPSNPFDCIMYCYPNLFLLELKSTKGTSISFKGSSPMIKEKQIAELQRGSKFKGIISGFLFNFRTTDNTYFMPIDNFITFINSTDKSSINEKDIITNKAIVVKGELKRTRHKYYLGEFIREATPEPNFVGKFVGIRTV